MTRARAFCLPCAQRVCAAKLTMLEGQRGGAPENTHRHQTEGAQTHTMRIRARDFAVFCIGDDLMIALARVLGPV